MIGRIELLGRVAVHGKATPSAAGLPGRRAELVFAYLAAEHQRVVTQDELADALWPDALPDSWAAALRGVITEVRRYLEEAGLGPADMLLTARRGYQLQLPADVVVDIDEAGDALARARALLEAGAGSEAAAHAGRSAALARLPFLPNHDGEWVDGTRRELESIHRRALDVEARGHRAGGDLTAAAAAAELLVRCDPFNEAGHQLRIRILGEAGDRAGAVRAYEHCRTVLAEELGVEPAAETEAALRAAMQKDVLTGPGGPSQPATASLSALTVLVVEDHDFQRRTAVRLLHGLGVGNVSEAADGVAALGALTSSPQPDVIICDIDMPAMDGVEFIRRVAERGFASAVVIASGLDSKVLDAVKVIAEGHGIQMLGALEKPLTPRRLLELLALYRRRPVQPPSTARVAVTSREVVAALADGQMTTLFEPVVDLAECRVNGAEAVGRWIHRDKGSIPTEAFLPILAGEGLLLDYAEAMLKDVCAALRQCRSAGVPVEIGLDLAPSVLGTVTLADRFVETVRGSEGRSSEVVCEVTEETLRTAPPIALDVMTRLRIKGFGLALDHYDVRHRLPERLTHVPFTHVKIEGSLLAAAGGQEGRALLEEMADVAESLAVPVVALGCESEASFDLAVDMGFRYAQGSFIGPAMAAAELVEWARSWSPPATGAQAAR